MLNKDTLTALLILALSFWFFNSRPYYQLIKQPYPADLRPVATAPATVATPTAVAPAGSPVAPAPVPAVVVPTRTITRGNAELSLSISEHGGRIVSAKMLKFHYPKSHPQKGQPIDLILRANEGIVGVSTAGTTLDSLPFLFNEGASGKNRLVFEALWQGQPIRKVFTLPDSGYQVGFAVESPQLAGKPIAISFTSPIAESESPESMTLPYTPRGFYGFDGKHLEAIRWTKIQSADKSGNYQWSALTSMYFTLGIKPAEGIVRDLKINAVGVNSDLKVDAKNVAYNFVLSGFAKTNAENYTLYLGPNTHTSLKAMGDHFERVIFKGYGWFFGADQWFPPLCGMILHLLFLLEGIFHDYGVAIIMITIILKLVTWPLTQSSMKSMSQMKDIQPKIQKLQEKYKNNPQLLQQKMLEFYKEEKVNPLAGLGGCLPMIMQMPIMIALFIVLRKAIELRGETTVLVPWLNDLSLPEKIFTLPFTIPLYGDNVAVLPILMAVAMYFQNKQTITDPNQKMMIYMMPVMMLVMFNNFPAGLTLYFTFSSLLQILQQWLLERSKRKNASMASVVK